MGLFSRRPNKKELEYAVLMGELKGATHDLDSRMRMFAQIKDLEAEVEKLKLDSDLRRAALRGAIGATNDLRLDLESADLAIDAARGHKHGESILATIDDCRLCKAIVAYDRRKSDAADTAGGVGEA